MKTLETITKLAGERGLNFVLGGGHAVITHGHARTTFDLDLIVRREDLKPWSRLAEAAGYRLCREGSTFVQFTPITPERLPLDLMLVNSETFSKLLAEAIFGPPALGGAPVVSLNHLLALKCHAIKHGHPGRIVKDADDVIRLVLANKIDVRKPEIRQLFLKHGTPELYEKIRRICGQE